jgi:hypothetical protein
MIVMYWIFASFVGTVKLTLYRGEMNFYVHFSLFVKFRIGGLHVILLIIRGFRENQSREKPYLAYGCKSSYLAAMRVTWRPRFAEFEKWRTRFINKKVWNESNKKKRKQCQTALIKVSDNSFCAARVVKYSWEGQHKQWRNTESLGRKLW